MLALISRAPHSSPFSMTTTSLPWVPVSDVRPANHQPFRASHPYAWACSHVAGEIIRDKLASRPEVDVWVPGIKYSDGRCVCGSGVCLVALRPPRQLLAPYPSNTPRRAILHLPVALAASGAPPTAWHLATTTLPMSDVNGKVDSLSPMSACRSIARACSQSSRSRTTLLSAASRSSWGGHFCRTPCIWSTSTTLRRAGRKHLLWNG